MHQNSKQQSKEPQISQDQLHPLPDQPIERPKICTPKLIILTFLASIYVFKNLYNHFMYPIPEIETKVTIQPGANEKVIWERLSGYIVLSAVLFIVFICLRRKNDEAEQKEIQAQLTKQQKQAKKQSKQLFQQQNPQINKSKSD